jgi:hypothetical protein
MLIEPLRPITYICLCCPGTVTCVEYLLIGTFLIVYDLISKQRDSSTCISCAIFYPAWLPTACIADSVALFQILKFSGSVINGPPGSGSGFLLIYQRFKEFSEKMQYLKKI